MKFFFLCDNNLPFLLNNKNYPVGGATIQSLNWINGLKKHNYNVVVISNNNIVNNSDYIIENISFSNIFNFKSILLFIKLIKKYNPDFIYISVPWWTNIFFYAANFKINKIIIQRISNDYLVDDRIKNKIKFLKYYIYNYYLSKTDILLCQNKYQKEQLINKFKKNKILKIFNPFSISNKINSKSNRYYVAWVGIFQYQKNLKALLHIVDNMKNIKFKIAGESLHTIDNETKENLLELKKRCNVEFVGLLNRKDILKFLSKAYCLLNTSHYEGFSNTYLESLSVGTPIVTRHQTDPDNIIHENNLGISVSKYSELSDAIIEIIDKNNNDNYKDYIIKNHNPEKIAGKLIKILKDD